MDVVRGTAHLSLPRGEPCRLGRESKAGGQERAA